MPKSKVAVADEAIIKLDKKEGKSISSHIDKNINTFTNLL